MGTSPPIEGGDDVVAFPLPDVPDYAVTDVFAFVDGGMPDPPISLHGDQRECLSFRRCQ